MTDLKALFNRCLNAQYKHVENDGDYASKETAIVFMSFSSVVTEK